MLVPPLLTAFTLHTESAGGEEAERHFELEGQTKQVES